MTSSSPTTPDLGGTTVRLRQRTAEPNTTGTILMVAVIIYTFACGFVYWLMTGSTTLGVGGRLTPLGQILTFGPFVVMILIFFVVGDRGPFRALYLPHSTIDVDDDGISWWTPSAASRVGWASIGGVSCLGEGTAQITTVYDPAGIELGSITGPMSDTRTRRASRLPEVILEIRLDLFEALDPKVPGNGCVRRSASA